MRAFCLVQEKPFSGKTFGLAPLATLSGGSPARRQLTYLVDYLLTHFIRLSAGSREISCDAPPLHLSPRLPLLSPTLSCSSQGSALRDVAAGVSLPCVAPPRLTT